MTKKNSTKRALVTSVLAIVLCLTMLIGTTFAWFTDTATTGVNKIESGTLKVDIVKEDGITSLKGDSMSFVNVNDSDDILWEPGATFKTTAFKIKNDGSLALKYKLALNDVTGDKELLDVIKFSVVDAATDKDVDLDTFVGNLAANGGLSDELYIKGHMAESAGNEYQNMTLESLGITVYATQDTVEYDSTTNEYDKGATLDFIPVSSTEELKAVFKNAKAGETVNVSLNADVTISNNELSVVNETQSGIGVGVGDININANGHTIKTTNSGTRCVKIECSDTARNITISGAKIVSESTVGNSSENRGVQIFSVNNATINLVNCDIEMKSKDYSYPVKIGGTSENLTINITGCTLTGANCIESFGKNCTVNITDCVLNSNYGPNETYCGQGIQDKNGTNNTYNIKNTTFNGTNAQKWQTNATTTINDLGGNVDNTTRTYE